MTYLSHATSPLDVQQLQELLSVSRERNLDSGITGMLLYAKERFIQTLEGDRDAVDVLMERIKSDRRHHQVDITLVEDIEVRHFSGWSMGFKAPSATEMADTPGFTEFLQADPEPRERRNPSSHAKFFLRSFRDSIPPDLV